MVTDDDANQWTGFYMITASVWKGLKQKMKQSKWTGITVILTKEYGQTNTFMSIMLIPNAGMWMWGPFHNKCGFIVNWENVCKCTRSCNKTTYFCLKRKLIRKGNVGNFWLHPVIFFTKFE